MRNRELTRPYVPNRRFGSIIIAVAIDANLRWGVRILTIPLFAIYLLSIPQVPPIADASRPSIGLLHVSFGWDKRIILPSRFDVLLGGKFQNKPFVMHGGTLNSDLKHSKLNAVLNMREGRFVLLRHVVNPECPRPDHWDLMLLWDDKLITFELLALPTQTSEVCVTRLENHRKHYLDFEGILSGNRGNVTRIAAGDYYCNCCAGRFELSLTSSGLSAKLSIPAENSQWCDVGCQTSMSVIEWNLRPSECERG